MAFHKNRGGSRGRDSGPRGRGISGRGKRPIFDSARMAQRREEEEHRDSESEQPSTTEEEPEIEAKSSDDDDIETLPPIRSYSVLMQSLAEDLAPQAKRQKLTHSKDLTSTKEVSSDDSKVLDEQSKDPDVVEEAEEGPETATDGLLEEEDDLLEDTSDPFEAHFVNPEDNRLLERLKALRLGQWATELIFISQVGKVVGRFPRIDNAQSTILPTPISGPSDLKLKQKLASVFSKRRSTFHPLESLLGTLMFNYQDILYCERSPLNSGNLRQLACLHAVNHIFKTRDRVIKNNARLAKEGQDDVEVRDQGFTRPKILMILPTRESCRRMVDEITSLCEPEQEENRKRFDTSYVDRGEKFAEDKPADFRELFGGNDDDMFRLGLKFTRKTIKYFSQFYNSDIIFASPLGLRMALEGRDNKAGDYDFLSSIEIVIVDQADALLMQNWEHVEYIFDHLNLQPKEAHGCDFSRVRNWYLDNNARYFRQTITLAGFNTPELNTLFFNQSKNLSGKVRISDNHEGMIQGLELKVKQTFSRVDSPALYADPDARFKYFISAIIPSLTRRSKDSTGTVIFIPSYLDFVRVRNYFSKSPDASSLSFASISEYTSVRDVAKARSHFFNERHKVLLYTERAHHFRRYQLRAVRRVIMYGLPENPIFYKEIVGGYLGRSVREGRLAPDEATARAIFSKWDGLKLERIVGTERARKMLKEKGDTFDFL